MILLNRLLDRYFIIFRHTLAIGDQLLITAILPKIKEKYKRPIIVFTNYTELFENNPYIFKIINHKNISQDDAHFLFYDTQYEKEYMLGIGLLMNQIIKQRTVSEHIHEFAYPWMKPENAHMKKSIVDFFSTGLNIDTTNCLPEIYLSEQEKIIFLEKYKMPNNYYLIHSEGIKSTKFKEYDVDKLQQIIFDTNNKINWVQIGTVSDKRLDGTKFDLCGILNLRELFACFYYSDKVLSIHGLQSIIATAFNKKNYCILTDYLYPEQTPYKNIKYITRKNFHIDPCSICKGWYCGCNCKYKRNWKNDIDVNDIIQLLLNDL